MTNLEKMIRWQIAQQLKRDKTLTPEEIFSALIEISHDFAVQAESDMEPDR